MNREIKFRGKLISTGKWVYGSYIQNYHNQYFVICKQFDFFDNDVFDNDNLICDKGCFNSNFEVDPKTVGQYIGLEDKSKKEIYDGDIIKHPNGELATIKWDKISCSFRASYTEYDDLSVIFLQINDKGLAVVIGNIHDNPELLEQNNEQRD